VKGYTYRQMFWFDDRYEVLNPSRVAIAEHLSWRVARKIADALNGIQFQQLLLARLETELKLYEARALNAQQKRGA
jgi:hypothetical protein